MYKFSVFLLLFAISLESFSDSIIDVDNYQALTSDNRSYRVGEPIVILVVESTSAESSAATGIKKSIDIQAKAFDNINEPSVGVGLSGNDDGSGQTIRKGRATTTLSTRITEILPNDLYRISGVQLLVINGETQKITLSGIVRAKDISKDNTLISSRIADAEIEIHGDGAVSDAQRQSILYKVFQWLGIL